MGREKDLERQKMEGELERGETEDQRQGRLRIRDRGDRGAERRGD